MMLTTFFCGAAAYAQNSDNFAGQYKLGTTLIILKPNKTFLLLDMGTLIKGNIHIDSSTGKLIPYKPKDAFVLYGRTNHFIKTGNTIHYRGPSEAPVLINYNDTSSSPNTLKPIFNQYANCIPFPTVIHNLRSSPKLYVTIIDSESVYTFENNEGYNDFVLSYIEPSTPIAELSFTILTDGASIMIKNETLHKLSSPAISEAEEKMLLGMYDRDYPETDFFYCNPAYNIFEESGVRLSQYNKVQNGNVYYFLHTTITKNDDYSNPGIIYEYKKINAMVLKNIHYAIDTGSVFHFECKDEDAK